MHCLKGGDILSSDILSSGEMMKGTLLHFTQMKDVCCTFRASHHVAFPADTLDEA